MLDFIYFNASSTILYLIIRYYIQLYNVLNVSAGALPPGFPYFRTEPKTKAVEIDHTALLVCDARGSPDPTITWYKDHSPVDVNHARYTVLRSGK